MELSPARPIYRSDKQNPQELEKYLKRTFPELRRVAVRLGAEISFVGEFAVRRDHHRGTTWGKIGSTPVVEASGDRLGLKLISAVSPRKDMRFTVIERWNGSAVREREWVSRQILTDSLVGLGIN